MASEVTASKVAIKLKAKTFGCAQSASFSTKRAMTSVPCQANGAFAKQIPGMESWDGSITAIMRTFSTAEEAANVTFREIYTTMREGALVDVEYAIEGIDGIRLTSKAYLTNVDVSVPDSDGVVTWTAGLVGAEPLLIAA
jgi:hypothetical protein